MLLSFAGLRVDAWLRTTEGLPTWQLSMNFLSETSTCESNDRSSEAIDRSYFDLFILLLIIYSYYLFLFIYSFYSFILFTSYYLFILFIRIFHFTSLPFRSILSSIKHRRALTYRLFTSFHRQMKAFTHIYKLSIAFHSFPGCLGQITLLATQSFTAFRQEKSQSEIFLTFDTI